MYDPCSEPNIPKPGSFLSFELMFSNYSWGLWRNMWMYEEMWHFLGNPGCQMSALHRKTSPEMWCVDCNWKNTHYKLGFLMLKRFKMFIYVKYYTCPSRRTPKSNILIHVEWAITYTVHFLTQSVLFIHKEKGKIFIWHLDLDFHSCRKPFETANGSAWEHRGIVLSYRTLFIKVLFLLLSLFMSRNDPDTTCSAAACVCCK